MGSHCSCCCFIYLFTDDPGSASSEWHGKALLSLSKCDPSLGETQVPLPFQSSEKLGCSDKPVRSLLPEAPSRKPDSGVR